MFKAFTASRWTGGKDVAPMVPEPIVDNEAALSEKERETGAAGDEHDADSNTDDEPSKDAPEGVQKIEAMAIVWTKKELYVAYTW